MPKNWSYRGAVRTFCVTRRPCCLAPFRIVGCPSLTQSRDRFIGASIKVNISIDSGLRSSVETLPPQSNSLGWFRLSLFMSEYSSALQQRRGRTKCNVDLCNEFVGGEAQTFGSFAGLRRGPTASVPITKRLSVQSSNTRTSIVRDEL
jgi:hypothetical protein